MKILNKKIEFPFISMWISLAVICFGIIYYRPSVFMFIPLLVTQIIMLLQSKVSRFALLLGAINSIFYAIAYTKQTLYSVALYALLVSLPLQIVSFISWSKNTTGNKTKLRELSVKKRFYLFGGMIITWIMLYLIFSGLGSKYLILDNTISVVGIVSTILCMLRFKEYTFLQMVSVGFNLVTYSLMLRDDPSSIMWLASVTHTLVCVAYAWINMNKKEETT